jgi:hypothetical protein
MRHLVEKCRANVVFDLHNSPPKESSHEFLDEKCESPQEYQLKYTKNTLLKTIEIPAAFRDWRFGRYGIIELVDFDCRVYYREFYDPRLPLNRANFERQKNFVKRIIENYSEN